MTYSGKRVWRSQLKRSREDEKQRAVVRAPGVTVNKTVKNSEFRGVTARSPRTWCQEIVQPHTAASLPVVLSLEIRAIGTLWLRMETAIGVRERQSRTEGTKRVTFPWFTARKIMIVTMVKAILFGGRNVEVPCDKNRPRIGRANVLTVPNKATVITSAKSVLQSNVNGSLTVFQQPGAGCI